MMQSHWMRWPCDAMSWMQSHRWLHDVMSLDEMATNQTNVHSCVV